MNRGGRRVRREREEGEREVLRIGLFRSLRN